MTRVSSAIVRQWHLLALLPRSPRRIDASALEALLRGRGFIAHRRTIQRDLVELAGVFPILSDERTKPYGWCWADGALTPFPSEAAGSASSVLVEVGLLVAPHALASVAASLGVPLRAPSSKGTPRVTPATLGAATGASQARPGFIPFDAHVRDGAWLRRTILALGDIVEVVHPGPLRDAVARTHARAAARYASAGRYERDRLP